MGKVMVIGSISTDFNVISKKRPTVGETIRGQSFSTSFGGKGANQALAAARLGADVKMVGTVGKDGFGVLMLDNLKNNGIDIENIQSVSDTESGSAHIILVDNDNSIIYIPGANNHFAESRLKKLEKEIEKMDFVVLQNEIPMSIVEKLIDICYDLNVKTIYNPAPAENIDYKFIEKVTYLTPNETEFNVIFPELSIEEGVKEFPGKLIVTLGSKGIMFHDGEELIKVPAYNVEVKDTTGAGDSFNGALAYALSNRIDLKTSVYFANLVASISIQKYGAQGGMPTLDEVKNNEHYKYEWNIVNK